MYSQVILLMGSPPYTTVKELVAEAGLEPSDSVIKSHVLYQLLYPAMFRFANIQTLFLSFNILAQFFCAEGGTRTPTGLLPPAPQADAATVTPLPHNALISIHLRATGYSHH